MGYFCCHHFHRRPALLDQFDDLKELFARATAFEPRKYESLSGSGYFHQAKVVDAIPLDHVCIPFKNHPFRPQIP